MLGLVAGTCAGYLIQADREPTALPSLSQPVLRQATGPAPTPLTAAQDRKVKTDGDLRKLLLKKPDGAKDLGKGDGWESLADYAEGFGKPGTAFRQLGHDRFRRAAAAHWQVGSTYFVDIRLVQFREEETVGAATNTDNDQYWADKDEDTDSWPLPGTGNGTVYVHHQAKDGLYSAEAYAWRGDISMEIWVYDAKPIAKAKIMDLARRQWERL